jgi:hypothetical protein
MRRATPPCRRDGDFEGKGIEPLPFARTRAARRHMRPFVTLPFNGEASDYISQWLPRLT